MSNVKPKPIKLIECRGKHLPPWVRQRYFKYNTKNTKHKIKVDKLDFIRIKHLYALKDPVKRM